ncbi:MAG: N-acetylmuramoyl-L-alanine amidase [Gemmatimonadota bacterium]|nr:N-acetylmuramoyl-L-alanine amidase [Gemmatimonadota bacterium]
MKNSQFENIKIIGFLTLAALVLVSGCSLLRFGADPAGYGAAGLSYEGYDFTVLKGKTIVLDPGHGGRYNGAVGRKGLTEKEINLRVATILRDLLVRYGARVVMTRTSDVDFLPEGAQGPLRADLKARTDTSNAVEDEAIFISIHHNSLGVPDKRYNATETYYKMGDTGPSLDLARYLHRHLNQAVGLPRESLRPGNYYVLRNNRHTAVLGEASYLSHPGAERKLSGQAAPALEAYAYLLGIVDYLSGGVPVVEDLTIPGASPFQDAFPTVVARVCDETGGRGIDPQRIEVTIDGRPVPFAFEPAIGRVEAVPPEALANGPHRLAVRVRNLSGNAAREAVLDFSVAVPPAHILLYSSLGTLPLDGRTPAQVRAVVTDTRGRPVADGTGVLFEFSDPNQQTRTIKTRDGIAMVTVTAIVNRPLEVRASAGDLSDMVSIPVGAEPEKALLVLKTLDHRDEVLGAVRVKVAGVGSFSTGPEGLLTLKAVPAGTCELVLGRAGYLPRTMEITLEAHQARVVTVQLLPAVGGALLGRKVAIDPRAGGAEAGQQGARGTREADLNLAVAKLLADYLERAGAVVILTHDDELNPGPWERAAQVDGSGAEILVSIAHHGKMDKKKARPPGTTVHHYPSSTSGKRLAGLIADCLRGFAGRPYFGPGPGYARIIQQVRCPAVQVRAASVADPEIERKLSGPICLRQEAHGIFTGICRYFGWEPDNENPHLTGRLSDGAGGVIPGALVLLDGWRPAQSDDTGRFLFQFVEPGKHRLEISHAGQVYGPHQVNSGHRLEILLEKE